MLLSKHLLKLYFIPGVATLLILTSFYFLELTDLPSILVMILADIFVVIPLFWILIKVNNSSLKQIFKHQKKISVKTFILISFSCLIWALICFLTLKPISLFLKNTFFNWLPSWFLLSDYLTNHYNYNSFFVKTSWWLLLLFSILIPIAEEIYFRGFLLRKTNSKGIISPIVNTLLFCIYHFWSLWLIPTRFIATLPLYYFVWKKQNIYLGIIVHCLLNIVGDVILTYHLVFD